MRLNPLWSGLLGRHDTVSVETLFSKCLNPLWSGLLGRPIFYTCLIGNTAISGFLRPEDTFAVEKVKPKLWKSFGDGFEYSNMGFGVKNHEEYHNGEVKRLLKKDNTCCPSRLRKLRDFTFFE